MMCPSTRQRESLSLATASIPTILLSITALIQPALANPFPKDSLHDVLGNGFLQDRLCASYCGLENEHCCSEGESCTTQDNIAGCAAQPTLAPREPQAGGVWSVYTTTWTETDTYTSTISGYWATSTAAGGGSAVDCVPTEGSGEIACGSICCASWQYCAYEGQCLSNPGATATDATTAWTTYSTTMTTSGSTITTQFSAPYRVTGTGSTSTNTATFASATTTGSGNGTAITTTGGSNLSGGAIAGIVVGTLAGVALLLALCFCCIMRGLWHGLLALLGFGPKKRDRSRERETIIVEEEIHRRGSTHGHRNSHNSWFAGRPARSTAAESRRTSEKVAPKKESDNATWVGAGALGTLMLLLGLRRDKKRRSQSASAAANRNSRRTARSEVSSSYFSDSYTASSPSELSSDYTYSSVYTPAPAPAPKRSSSQNPRGVRSASVARSQSVRSASRYRDDDRGDYDYIVVEEDPPLDARHYDHPPKSNLPHDYAGSASSGGRTRDTRDTRRSRRTETTRISRAPSRR